jgi:MYXO-CTERM domain-containing protein
MDPEDALPAALAVFALVGVLARRGRRRVSPAASTLGQDIAAAGGAVSRASAKVLGSAGAFASALAGTVVDGAFVTAGVVLRPVVGAGARAATIGSSLVPHRNGTAPAPRVAERNGRVGDVADVVASARGKRFHRLTCALAPAEGVTMTREAAVASDRQPCGTCQP